ncbi:MAG: hypothetical protein R3F02_16795 [Thiolinea sp.]
MQIMNLRKYLGLGASTLLLVSNGAWAGQVLDYSIRWSTADERYHVFMKPTQTPSPDRSMTSQVTIVVPHAEGSNSFEVNSLTSRITGITWSQNSRANSPSENTQADYLSFTLTASNAAAFQWQSEKEIEVFSFSNNGACIGPVALIDNQTDPFIIPVNNGGSNSARTNPGNQFSNLGWTETFGESNYRTNYGDPADCRDSFDDDLDGLKNGEEKALGSDLYNPDTDGDGIIDGMEVPDPANPLNTDGDALLNVLDNDDDNDGVLTIDEDYDFPKDGPLNDDTDSDGIPDYLDADDDGDGVPTKNENYNGGTPKDDNTDGDSKPDYLDADDDGDGVLTKNENYNGGTPEDDNTDGDSKPDYLDADDDGDGKPSKNEGNDPNGDGKPADAQDTDGDGKPDYLDVNDSDGPKGDPDGDGVPNDEEEKWGSDPNNPDDDGDGIPTREENYNGGSPTDDDTDQDGIPDFMDTDDDGDGILTRNENYNGGTPQDDNTDGDSKPDYLDTDDDGDGVLTKYENYNGGTPGDDNTDGDSKPDYLDADDDGDGKLSKDESNDPNGDGKPDDALDSDGDGKPNYLDTSDDIAGLQVRVMLQGSYDGVTGMMSDDLRVASMIPAAQPYKSAPFSYNGSEQAAGNLLLVSGQDAIVDWVLVELRDKLNSKNIVARQAALVQRDGDVVDALTGEKTLNFTEVVPGEYMVSIRHRNHLGAMASEPVRVQANPPLVDFTSVQTLVYGSNARTVYKTTALLWAGNADSNSNLIANGPGQDTAILIGSVLIDPGNSSFSTNYVLDGYNNNDLNMDGKTIVAGPGNDLNLLMGNILLHPVNYSFSANFIIPERLP